MCLKSLEYDLSEEEKMVQYWLRGVVTPTQVQGINFY